MEFAGRTKGQVLKYQFTASLSITASATEYPHGAVTPRAVWPDGQTGNSRPDLASPHLFGLESGPFAANIINV